MFNIENKLNINNEKLFNFLNYNGNNIEEFYEKINNYLKNNKNDFVMIYQIYTSYLLNEEIYRYRNENKKLKYMEKEEINIISKLDEKIKEEWIGFFGDNKYRTNEFIEKIENREKYLKENNIKYNYENDVYNYIMEIYRKEMLEKLKIKDDEKIKDLKKERKQINWNRKFQININNDILKFDYRNSLTTIYTIGNEKNGFNIIGIGGGGSSFQRQTFTELNYLFFKITINKKNKIKNKFYYYNGNNELELIKEQDNKFLINFDLGSNSDIFRKEENIKIKNKIEKSLDYINGNFSFNKESIYNKQLRDFNLIISKNKKEGLIYVEQINENNYKFYFGDIINSYGDDWNDNYFLINSGKPYDDFIYKIIEVKNINEFTFENTNSSLDEIKNNKLIYFKFNNKDFYFGDNLNNFLNYILEINKTKINKLELIKIL